VDPAPTRYLDRDGAALAYQVVGSGPHDVLWSFELSQHLDLCWTDPWIHQVFDRGATFSRAVYVQPRGFGLSDRLTYVPSLDQQADDVVALMDELDLQQVTLVGVLSTCGPVAVAAARVPDRVKAVVLVHPFPQGMTHADDPPEGWTEEEKERFLSGWDAVYDHWGSGESIDMWDPLQGSAFNRRLMGLLERCSATPASGRAYYDDCIVRDIRDVLRSVQAPTRVLRLPSSPVPEAVARHAADLVQDGTFHELPPTLPGAAVGEAWLPIVDHVEEVATGSVTTVHENRFLGSVLFTDIVGSTELLARIGDTAYRDLLEAHERQVRVELERTGGELVKLTGDGTFCMFDSPTLAVRCGAALCEAAPSLGIQVRAGVHTGEVEQRGDDYAGLTVHIGARVSALAAPGQVLVSRTVRDLLAGSNLTFVPHGVHELKGVPDEWTLYALGDSTSETRLPAETSMETVPDRAVLWTARRAPALARTAMRVGNAWQRRRASSAPG
jgi:class 3 adenylate cyclase/pimeloyl-ACP methyl ester carboxylesterase